MTIRRIEHSELKKVGRTGVTRPEDLPPTGISPVLRASWRFARETAESFSKQLMKNRTKEFLDNLAKRFT